VEEEEDEEEEEDDEASPGHVRPCKDCIQPYKG